MERLRARATPEAFARKVEFIETAMQEGAHQKPSKIKNLSPEDWKRRVGIGILYNMGPDTTLESMGNLYGVKRERIRQQNKAFLKSLHANCSPETKGKYPLLSIPFDKPIQQTSREKHSQARGGIALKVKEEIEKGVTASEKIAEGLKLPVKKIWNTRYILRRWGVDGLSIQGERLSYKEIKDRIEKETDDGGLQQILDDFSKESLHGFLGYYRHRQSIFISLGNVLRELGFNFKNARSSFEILRSEGIPIKKIEDHPLKRGEKEYKKNYYVFYTKHKKRVIEAIKMIDKTDPKGLDKVDIELICGQLDENSPFPSTYVLQRRIGYLSAGKFIEGTTGIRFLGCKGKPKIANFLEGCPIPVFRIAGGAYLFPANKQTEFGQFIKKRYKELFPIGENH